uniref:Lamin tail domain containing 2 n=1 Tax=Moschus moschiferus TaxID=68415 RepID=A0A8C6CZU0_MOSMO
MAPKSCQEAEDTEEEALASLVDQEPVSGYVGPPAAAVTDPVAPTCPQDAKSSSTRMASSMNLQPRQPDTLESLDPRTLRLLCGQRELEIQALRWAIQNQREARHCYILQEVAGLPAERSVVCTGPPPTQSSRSQDTFLKNQVQKLTLELKAQKEKAQLQEKKRLEERLQQTEDTLQQLEAELQAFQKSCLLQLARSSWVGRVLRSSTGSVEVVTAETLMDFSDFSENDQAPTAGEGFRLEDVDWNSIAHRYPNLFTNLESNSDQSADLGCRHQEHNLKSVEWSCLPLGASSSGGADSESSNSQLAAHKVTGDRPPVPDRTAEQVEARAQSLCRDSQATFGGGAGDPTDLAQRPCLRSSPSPTGSCLKIVAVSRRQRFVRILNQSLEETVDLGGFVLQQLVLDFPVCMYRFPPSTLLAPRHHITVWGEGPRSTRRQQPSFLGQEPVHFYSGRSYVTLLLNPQGEVLSEHQSPYCVTPVSRIFADNTDLSIDCFPLSETWPGADLADHQPQPRPPRKGRVREARSGRRRPGWGPRVPQCLLPPQARTWPRVQLPRLSTIKLLRQREVPVWPEDAAQTHPDLLPAIPSPGECEAGRNVEEGRPVCRKRVDRGCPMVALSVQSTAESRFGFRFLSCPPITADTRWPL